MATIGLMLIENYMDLEINQIKKILIIKPRGIGDIILSTVVLENLHNHFQEAKIDYLVEAFAKEALENIPLINKILIIEKSEIFLKILRKIRNEKYDLVIDLWSNPRTAQITFFSGARFKLGYEYRGRKYAYNLSATTGRGNSHSALHNLELLKSLNIPISSKKIHFYLNENEKQFAERYFFDNNLSKSFVFGIIPSGGWESKRFPAVKWVELCNALIEKLDCKILILWGPGDKDDAEFIKSSLESNSILAPKTNLREMASLISKCNLVIANDSGPMHISAALNIPTLGLFGPTDPNKHGPFSINSDYIIKKDLHCIICNQLKCPFNQECFNQMDINEIIFKVNQLIENNVKTN